MAIYSLDVQDIGLTDENVARILDELDARQSAPNAEQRRQRRDRRRGKAALIVMQASLPPAAAHWIRLRNISDRGVAFLKHGPLRQGTYVRLELPTGHDGRTVTKQATVRHCRQVEGQICEIGVEFLPDINA